MMKKAILLLIAVLIYTACFCQSDIVDFEELDLSSESYWNGSDLSGSFTSKYLKLYNNFDQTYSSWIGWAYSNTTDTTNYSYTNYSSASGHGAGNSEKYAVCYVGSDWMNNYAPIPSIIKIEQSQFPQGQFGMYLSLAAYTNLYMEDNNFYQNGNHYLLLHIEGLNTQTDISVSRDIYLADYRIETTNHFKLTEWTYIDMAWASSCDSLFFTLESSDSGEYGINTPTYFCIDNFGCQPQISVPEISEFKNLKIYNTNDLLVVENSKNISKIDIYDVLGKLTKTINMNTDFAEIYISDLKNGIYILNIYIDGQQISRKIDK